MMNETNNKSNTKEPPKTPSAEIPQKNDKEPPPNWQRLQIIIPIIVAIITCSGTLVLAATGLLGTIVSSVIDLLDKPNYPSTQPLSGITFTPTSTSTGTISTRRSITQSPTATLSPTITFTPTITITPTPSEPIIPTGYTIYDTFEEALGVRWDQPKKPVICKEEVNGGTVKIECTGNGVDSAGFTMEPLNPDSASIRGLAMAFRTLPVPNDATQWGKYQIYLRFGSDCQAFERMYKISILPGELGFYEYWDKDYNKPMNTPAPDKPNKIAIQPNQTQVIRIERTNDHVDFWLNDENVVQLAPPSALSSVCVHFQSDDNNKKTDKGYRGIELFWLATME